MEIEAIKQLYIERKKIFFASMELTQYCNFTCKHCYCSDKNKKNMMLENYLNIIDKLYDMGCLFLNFTGGEILTNKYFREIYTYAKEKGFIVDLMTNGSLINDNIIDLFLRLPPRNISITIYGTNSSEYEKFTGSAENFEKVMHGLDLLKANNINFVLRTIATQTFYDSLEKKRFEKIADHYDTDFRYDPIIFPKTSGDKTPLSECLSECQIVTLEKNNTLRKEAWKKIMESDNNFCWECKAGINSLAIDFEGNAFVCGLYRKRPISILNEKVEIVLRHLKEIHNEHVHIMETNECSECTMRKFCKWCPAYSYIYNLNETNSIDFFCKLTKERIKTFGENKE